MDKCDCSDGVHSGMHGSQRWYGWHRIAAIWFVYDGIHGWS
jgi:hypothetical protein